MTTMTPDSADVFSALKSKNDIDVVLNKGILVDMLRRELLEHIASPSTTTKSSRKTGFEFVMSAIEHQMASRYPSQMEMSRFVTLCTMTNTVPGISHSEYEAYVESRLSNLEAEVAAKIERRKESATRQSRAAAAAADDSGQKNRRRLGGCDDDVLRFFKSPSVDGDGKNGDDEPMPNAEVAVAASEDDRW